MFDDFGAIMQGPPVVLNNVITGTFRFTVTRENLEAGVAPMMFNTTGGACIIAPQPPIIRVFRQ